MNSKRYGCTGALPVHFFQKSKGVAVAAAIASAALVAPQPAFADSRSTQVAVQARPTQTIDDFYRSRNGAPLWLAATAGDAAPKLIALLRTSATDGLGEDRYQAGVLQALVDYAQRTRKPKDVARADLALSNAFVRYVSDLRQAPDVGITYVDGQLRPQRPTPLAALLTAAAQPSLSAYVSDIGWMHPIYAELREALTEHHYSDDHQRQTIELNLQRARSLPAGHERYVLVNAAQQRLYMYQDRKPVDTMVVVVGKPKWPTPMLSAYIRFAALNPYWYVPPDLAGEDVGQYVLKYGLKYLDQYGYEVVSDWVPNPTIIDPKTVDWKGVVDGTVQVLIRQKPGPKNFMGRIKFMFPNEFGVYLHDNPRRELFKESTRYFSGGCVRLEDAWRLGRWLFGRELTWEGAAPEEPVPLAQPVPVYITYLTAMPDGQSVAYYDDAYGRDKPQVAGPTDSAAPTKNASR